MKLTVYPYKTILYAFLEVGSYTDCDHVLCNETLFTHKIVRLSPRIPRTILTNFMVPTEENPSTTVYSVNCKHPLITEPQTNLYLYHVSENR